MSSSIRALRFAAAALVVSGGLIVASCGGGSIATTPISNATNAPASTQTVPSGGGSLTLPAAAGGQVATLAFAAGATGGVTVTASSSATGPGNAPAPSSLTRSTEAISGAVPFFYITFTVSGNLLATLLNSETVTLLASQPSNASYYVEFDDITSSPSTKLGCAGPGTVSGTTATVTNQSASGACSNTGGNSPNLVPGHTYLVQFYYVAAGTASPSPSPSSSASASPSAQPSATASAAVSGANLMGSSQPLPGLNNGAYTGALAQGSYSGLSGDQWIETYGNYNFGGITGPTPPPSSGTVYAEVHIAAISATNVSFTSGTAVPMTLTVPTTAGKSSVTVREWEAGTVISPLCLNFSTGAAAYPIVPGTGGLLTFATPLENSTVPIAQQTATGCTSIGSDFNINPTSTGGGAWIMVTDN